MGLMLLTLFSQFLTSSLVWVVQVDKNLNMWVHYNYITERSMSIDNESSQSVQELINNLTH